MEEIEEIIQTIESLQNDLDDLLVRGLRAVQSAALTRLRGRGDEFRRIGAEHMASQLTQLAAAIENDDASAAQALLQAQTSLRLFERVLTMEVAGATLCQLVADSEAGELA